MSGDRVAEQATDRLGRFTFETVEPGPVRISVIDPDGTPVVSTEWVLL
jgi:protocatechuate 3,4-dioxygenase beta subunit